MDIIDNQVKNNMLNKLRSLNLNIKDSDLEYALNKSINNILIKTHRNKFPKALSFLAVDIAEDSLKAILIENNPGDNQTVQSMSETGRSITLGFDDFTKAKLELLVNEKIKENSELINQYKLLYKVRCPIDEED